MLTDCLNCIHYDKCDQEDRWYGCVNFKSMPTRNPTNADRIRSMSDEELAEWIAELSDCAACKCDAKHPKCAVSDKTCAGTWLDWLKEGA